MAMKMELFRMMK